MQIIGTKTNVLLVKNQYTRKAFLNYMIYFLFKCKASKQADYREGFTGVKYIRSYLKQSLPALMVM